jgi:hypothetical protein
VHKLREGVSIAKIARVKHEALLKVSKPYTKRRDSISSYEHGNKTPNLIGRCELGGSYEKSAPIDICKRGGRIGEWDITYPLS